MKKVFLMFCLLAINYSYAQKQNCDDIKKALLEFKTAQLDEKINKGILKKGAFEALKLVIGRAATPISAFFSMPLRETTGRDAYWSAFKDIRKITNKSKLDDKKLKKALKDLKDAQNWILLERDFGEDENCYQNLKKLTDEITKACTAVCKI
ncbi:hypothetical protein [Gelidibacter japonicus]|uniref:hypothetical protein n=1 Tax=Gelidibacter japonicus TaxID=1962232 RepID=UPI003A946C65